MKTSEFRVEPAGAGVRLDQFLVGAAPSFSRARLQDLIKAGHVTLNGVAAKSSARLRAGDAITLHEPPPVTTETVAEDIALDVLFEDDDLIVVNKPAGLVVHPAAGNWTGTLVNALLHHCPTLSGIGGERRPGIVHRLDKETSGCVVVAKNDAAHQSLAKQFAGREVTKIYLALAAGKLARLSGTIEAAIGRHPVQRKKMTVVTAGRGRASKTSYRVVREVPAGTLVECTLHTGRTHQIRVHLKHLGHPVLGDEVYGKRGSFARQMLHAWRLGFMHPRTQERLNFESPIPADFVEAGVPTHLP
ncbi:MAG: RluA family pseudouridine synthase [Chthoniobacter sp.]|uniref:RluA family pseudouridine synthase n=1 Tax=Chthoniobacter sp. TaxID=2510640 RepID=UPI0032A1D8E8